MVSVTIVGSGAIGGLAGAWMTMAGEDVLLVDRWEDHVRAMQQDGLFVDGLRGEHRVRVKAATPAELKGPLDLVFLACKSHDTRAAVEGIKPLLDERSVVVSLQNGMNEELIGELIGPERVVGAIPDYGGALVGPGHLEFVHPGVAYVGELDGSITERAREAQRLLNHLVETELTTNVVGRIWSKQVHMSQVVMTALTDAPIAEVLRDMADRGIFLVPTLSVTDAHRRRGNPSQQERAEAVVDHYRRTLERALALGVRVAMGTDAGAYGHGHNAREVRLLVESGLTPMQALVASTSTAAACLRMQADVGTLEAGKYADLLVVDGDPLADTGLLEDPERLRLVLKGAVAYVDRLSTSN